MVPPSWDSQRGFDVRFDWGQSGVARLAPFVRALVVVDVLRFTTAVETAAASGVLVDPYRWKDASAQGFAASVGATLALRREGDGPSLSPPSLAKMAAGSRVVLPSPNGALSPAARVRYHSSSKPARPWLAVTRRW